MLKFSGKPGKISIGWILAASLLLGGSPVYSDISLEELVQRSDLILLVAKGNPDPDLRHQAVWNFTVVEVLFSRLNRSLHPGETIKIFQAGYDTLAADRADREGGGKGFSYSATRYLDGKGISGKQFIIFVQEKQSVSGVTHLELTAEGAFESFGKKWRILKLLGNHTASTP